MTVPTMRIPLRIALLVLPALLAGCLYRMPVQQGNMLDNTQVEQLQTGMTRSQVLYLLGTPMVPDGFQNNRWDYYHYIDTGRGSGRELRVTRRLTVWFADDKVERIDNDAAAPPTAAPAVTPAANPAATSATPSPG
jgi:outer membrane protein assembly factor BamE